MVVNRIRRHLRVLTVVCASLLVPAAAYAQAAITGILTLQDGYFIQLLEGAPAALDLLMIHLHFDERHEEIEVLGCQ